MTSIMPGGGIASRPLHLIVIADCSHSMIGAKMQSLNFAVETVIPILQEWEEKQEEAQLMLRVLQFGTEVKWHIRDPTPIAAIRWHHILVDMVEPYRTSMGQALKMVAETLENLESRAMVPALLLITDGVPTDDFDAGVKALLATRPGRSAIRLGLAMGREAEVGSLARFIDNPAIPVLRGDSSNEIVEKLRAVALSVTKMSETGADRQSIARDLLWHAQERGANRSGDDSII